MMSKWMSYHAKHKNYTLNLQTSDWKHATYIEEVKQEHQDIEVWSSGIEIRKMLDILIAEDWKVKCER